MNEHMRISKESSTLYSANQKSPKLKAKGKNKQHSNQLGKKLLKITRINKYLSVITLHLNALNSSNKRHRLADCINKQALTSLLCMANTLHR
jgi:hypothetical protein